MYAGNGMLGRAEKSFWDEQVACVRACRGKHFDEAGVCDVDLAVQFIYEWGYKRAEGS